MELRGKISLITYPKNLLFIEDKTYFIFYLEYQIDGHKKGKILCKGKAYKIFVDEEVKLIGDFEYDKDNNKTFKFTELIVDYSKTRHKEEFLKEIIGVDYFRKIKNNLSKKNIDYKKSILNNLENKNKTFFLNFGIDERIIEHFFKKVAQMKAYEKTFEKLAKYGFTERDIREILYRSDDINADKVVESIEKNPYKLMKQIGISFRKCDYIFSRAGGKNNAKERVLASIFEALKVAYNNGDCYLKQDELYDGIFKVLDTNYFPKKEEIDIETLKKIIFSLSKKEEIIEYKGRYFLKDKYSETTRLKKFCLDAINAEPLQNDKVNEFISKYEIERNFKLGKEQKLSIVKSLKSKISIITGGAGVGKTSSLACIISYLLEKGYTPEEIALCAPTGKASQRMQESIYNQVGVKMLATTIHVLLQVNPQDETLETFMFNEFNKLNKKVVVVDETSMLNYRIADALISAIRSDTMVIFLGDIEQLEPVGAGFFFRDMIESGVPTTYLKEIHRQKGNSTIISLSTAIRDEKLFSNDVKKANDFTFIEISPRVSIEEKLEAITKVFRRAVEKSSLDDVMIITPLRETENNSKVDSKTISCFIQDKILPDKEGEIIIERNGFKFKVGSKVIMTKNDNSRGLINGQIGYIEEIIVENQEVIVEFDNEKYHLKSKDLNNLRLAYAITVHKSQGSDWKNVIYCCFGDTIMNKKNLVYTAVTRAKTNLVIMGSKSVFLKSDKEKNPRKNSVLLNEKEAN